jgi:hypothetical protein
VRRRALLFIHHSEFEEALLDGEILTDFYFGGEELRCKCFFSVTCSL